jgi:hypothetical protein
MRNVDKTKIAGRIAVAVAVAVICWDRSLGHAGAQTLTRFIGATSSQSLALSADDSLLLVANPTTIPSRYLM